MSLRHLSLNHAQLSATTRLTSPGISKLMRWSESVETTVTTKLLAAIWRSPMTRRYTSPVLMRS
jgi:hypothetical protein